MKNKAFTLTEVLITMGLIGIVAALTMPTLVNLHQDAGIGPMLAKVQATLEEGIGRTLITNPDFTIPGDTDGIEDLKTKIGQHVIMNGSGRLKDGSVIEFATPAPTLPSGYTTSATGTSRLLINVDINGSREPNKTCIDKFQFALTSYGMVIPLSCANDIAKNNWKVPADYNPNSY